MRKLANSIVVLSLVLFPLGETFAKNPESRAKAAKTLSGKRRFIVPAEIIAGAGLWKISATELKQPSLAKQARKAAARSSLRSTEAMLDHAMAGSTRDALNGFRNQGFWDLESEINRSRVDQAKRGMVSSGETVGAAARIGSFVMGSALIVDGILRGVSAMADSDQGILPMTHLFGHEREPAVTQKTAKTKSAQTAGSRKNPAKSSAHSK